MFGVLPFDIESSSFPQHLDGARFHCANMDALLASAPGDYMVTVAAFSPGIVGMLSRAYLRVCTGELEGVIEWGPNNRHRLHWHIALAEGVEAPRPMTVETLQHIIRVVQSQARNQGRSET